MLKVKSQILKYIAFALGGMILGGVIALFELSFYSSNVSESSCSANPKANVNSKAPNISLINPEM